MAQALLLQGLLRGADKIPDKVFDHIPGYRLPAEDRDRRRSEQRSHHHRDEYDNDGFDDRVDYGDRRKSRNRHSRSQSAADYYGHGDTRRGRRKSHREDFPGEVAAVAGGGGALAGIGAASAYDNDNRDSARGSGLDQPLDSQDVHRSDWHDGHPFDQGNRNYQRQQDQNRQQGDTYNSQQTYQSYPPPQPIQDPAVAMSYNDSYPRGYNPSDYVPQDSRNDGRNSAYSPQRGGRSGGGNYDGDMYGRSRSANASGRYRDSYSSDEETYQDDKRSRRAKSRSRRSRSRSQSRFDQLKRKFDPSERGVATGALGALAGGFIGKEVGHGVIPTIAGAFLGGLAANAWEAKDAKSKARAHEREKEQRYGGRARSSDYASPYPSEVDSRTRRDLEYFERESRHDDGASRARSRSRRRSNVDYPDEDDGADGGSSRQRRRRRDEDKEYYDRYGG